MALLKKDQNAAPAAPAAPTAAPKGVLPPRPASYLLLGICAILSTIAVTTALVFSLMAMKALFVPPFN